jgi:hypothetical protein
MISSTSATKITRTPTPKPRRKSISSLGITCFYYARWRVSISSHNESLGNGAVNSVVDTQIANPYILINRYGLIGVLREHITSDLVAYADGIMTSDNLYLRDMDVYTLSHGYGLNNYGLLRTGNSDFALQQSFKNSYLLLDGMWIQDYIQAQRFALQKMPELFWSGRQNLGFGSALSIMISKQDDTLGATPIASHEAGDAGDQNRA